jgi:CubicO group peptidase (beta-lactamase class C family)
VADIAIAGNQQAEIVIARMEWWHGNPPVPCWSEELANREAASIHDLMTFLKESGARVVNMSWGRAKTSYLGNLKTCFPDMSDSARQRLAQYTVDTIRNVLRAGMANAPNILFVGAAGNAGSKLTAADQATRFTLANFILVGAVDQEGDLADFTNTGAEVTLYANGERVPVRLPGGTISYPSGTSMATPNVANAAAKMLAVNPRLTGAELRTILEETADLNATGQRLLHTGKAVASANQYTTQEPDIPALINTLDSLRKARNIPGLSVAVVRNQSIVFASGLGYADFENRIPAAADTPYDIASVTKPLSAVVALKLVEQGVLDLDRPMAAYSEWADFCTGFSEQPSIFAKDLRCNPTSHTLRHLLSHSATAVPGTRFSYNPVLYSWASRPIMSATSKPFSALVEQYVFTPAGMTQAARRHRDLPLREDLAQRLAPPHSVGTNGVIERAPALQPQGDGAAGGVITTVLDLARFDIALDQGLLISAASREAMMTPTRSNSGEVLPYGIGWYVQEYQGQQLVWHSGWWEDAYSALYLKIPGLDLTFIALANSEGLWWDNPLDKAEVDRSDFAQAFMKAFGVGGR